MRDQRFSKYLPMGNDEAKAKKKHQYRPGTDIGDFKAALEEHARAIAEEVHRIIQIDFEREAVI